MPAVGLTVSLGGGLAPHAITTLAGTPDALWCAARPGRPG